MPPKVSILFLFYNDEKYIRQCIESCVNQTYKNIEIIILDNASLDSSRQIVEEYISQNNDITLLTSDVNHYGGGLNVRKMLSVATGDYIKLFCADDVLESNCIEEMVQFLEQNPKYIACASHMTNIDQNGQKYGKTFHATVKHDRYQYLRHAFENYWIFPYPTLFIRKNVLRHEDCDLRLLHFYDVKLTIKLALQGEFGVIERPLVKYRTQSGDGNVSNLFHNPERRARYIWELKFLYEEFFKIQDVETIRQMFPEHRAIINKIGDDINLIPFVLAIFLYNFRGDKIFHYNLLQSIALDKLGYIMHDENLAAKIEERFNFTYSQLRELAGRYANGANLPSVYTKPRSGLRKLWYKHFTRHQLKKQIIKMNNAPKIELHNTSGLLAIFIKTYKGDFYRLHILFDSLAKYNKNNIPICVCMPKADFAEFNTKFPNHNFKIFHDEDILNGIDATFSKPTDYDKGWHVQQIIKLNVHLCNVAKNYLLVDSDSYFIKDFHVSDFVRISDGAPYTVMSEWKPYFHIMSLVKDNGTRKHHENLAQKVQNFFGRDGKIYHFLSFPVVFNANLLAQLKEHLHARQTTYKQILETCPFEVSWYGEFLIYSNIIPLLPADHFFLCFNYHTEYLITRQLGFTKSKISHNYFGLVMQNKYLHDIKYKEPSIFRRLKSKYYRIVFNIFSSSLNRKRRINYFVSNILRKFL